MRANSYSQMTRATKHTLRILSGARTYGKARHRYRSPSGGVDDQIGARGRGAQNLKVERGASPCSFHFE
jgi:hypothetical protein